MVLSIGTHQEVALEEASNHDIIFADDFVDENSKGSQNPIETNPKGSKNPIETQNPMDAKNTKSKSLLNQRKIYTCPICLKMIKKGHDLKRHLSIIHGFECQFCPLRFVLKRDMYDHVKFVHDGVKCNFCPEYVKNKSMSEHIALLHLIKCRFCSKKIAQGRDMKAHVASVHGIIKCQFCQEKLTYKNKHHHMKMFHKKISKDQLSTKVHKITNKKFECPLCSTIFSSHQERANHKKLKH